MRPARKSHRLRPAGAVLIVTLVCLAVVMALLGSMLLALMRTGRQLHVERVDRRLGARRDEPCQQ